MAVLWQSVHTFNSKGRLRSFDELADKKSPNGKKRGIDLTGYGILIVAEGCSMSYYNNSTSKCWLIPLINPYRLYRWSSFWMCNFDSSNRIGQIRISRVFYVLGTATWCNGSWTAKNANWLMDINCIMLNFAQQTHAGHGLCRVSFTKANTLATDLFSPCATLFFYRFCQHNDDILRLKLFPYFSLGISSTL